MNDSFYASDVFDLGNRRIVGQVKARSQLSKSLASGRISHAYLLAGPAGVGKKALALAFAEAINGVDHLSDLKGHAFSKKSSWYSHPDINLFLPLPSTVSFDELRMRIDMLSKDPYEIVDFGLRPSITGDDSSKNRNAFYSVKYFNEEIRKVSYYKPNEGQKNIVIITNVEKMRKEVANGFLKLLEEPGENLMFILTTDNPNVLLPTILSRCQIVHCPPLSHAEIENGLVNLDGIPPGEASYLARIAGGNYAMTRFYDTATLKTNRQAVIQFLRYSYMNDAVQISRTASSWQTDLNLEGQAAVLNMLEMFIRDLMVYMQTGEAESLINADQADVISKFCASLIDARLDSMLHQVAFARKIIYQNVSPKLIFTVIANRFTALMRGYDTVIPGDEPWHHLPAYTALDAL
jgi:DNA polymerase III subunit delta'